MVESEGKEFPISFFLSFNQEKNLEQFEWEKRKTKILKDSNPLSLLRKLRRSRDPIKEAPLFNQNCWPPGLNRRSFSWCNQDQPQSTFQAPFGSNSIYWCFLNFAFFNFLFFVICCSFVCCVLFWKLRGRKSANQNNFKLIKNEDFDFDFDFDYCK